MRTFTTTVSIVAGVLLLGACGGGGDSAGASQTTPSDAAEEEPTADAFCAGAQALYEQFLSAGSTDPSSVAMQEVFTAAEDLEPPAEIADDWRLILRSVEPVVMGEVDVDDPAAMQQVSEQAAANVAAFERVGTYIDQTCQITAPSTTAPVEPAPDGR